MKQNNLIKGLNSWRAKSVNEDLFFIILSIIIGLITGLAAALMKTAVIFIKDNILNNISEGSNSIILFLVPIIGISITVIFIHHIIKDPKNHGIYGILMSLSQRKGRIRREKSISAFFGGILTSAFGGSAGLESPIISTGTSISSAISAKFNLNIKQTSLLLGCGAAAAMSGIFFTPIASIIFVVEVLVIDLTANSIIPLLIASISAAIISNAVMPSEVVFQFNFIEQIGFSQFPFLIFLGIISGMMSLYFKRVTFAIHRKMQSYNTALTRLVIGASILGLLIYLFPALYGEGYDTLKLIIQGDASDITDISFLYAYKDEFWILMLIMLIVAFLKVVSTTLTIESGGVGGFFAPSVFTGGLLGYIFSSVINYVSPNWHLSVKEYTVVGMAGVMAGVMHAPLTAIFFAAEITQGYILIFPLMIVATISFVTSRYFEPQSVFTKYMADEGEVLSHHKDKTVLHLLTIKSVMDTDLTTIPSTITLKEFTKYVSEATRNVFPVVGNNNEFIGIVDFGDVRKVIFDKDKYNNKITDYMMHPKTFVSTSDKMETAMEKFNETGYYNMPVIDDGIYKGFISRSNTFSAYRKLLIAVSQD
ncbi:MAG: chloride channel protein [Bacteroidetes bacterium 4572_112]|nr:MAG: chloride channel protein [Bacteroidetes bacterium 4572_112]